MAMLGLNPTAAKAIAEALRAREARPWYHPLNLLLPDPRDVYMPPVGALGSAIDKSAITKLPWTMWTPSQSRTIPGNMPFLRGTLEDLQRFIYPELSGLVKPRTLETIAVPQAHAHHPMAEKAAKEFPDLQWWLDAFLNEDLIRLRKNPEWFPGVNKMIRSQSPRWEIMPRWKVSPNPRLKETLANEVDEVADMMRKLDIFQPGESVKVFDPRTY